MRQNRRDEVLANKNVSLSLIGCFWKSSDLLHRVSLATEQTRRENGHCVDQGRCDSDAMGDSGGRRKSSGRSSSGDKDQRNSGLPPVPRQKQLARRHNSAKDSGDIDDRYDDAVFDDASDTTTKEQLRRRVLATSCLLCL